MANNLKRYGLIGKDIGYSFSRGYFKEKFDALNLREHHYANFDLQNIEEFKNLIANNDDLYGLNVTIPYKQDVIPYLNELSEQATEIGAVNTIQFTSKGLVGHNTDAYGFENALLPFLKPHHQNALILGTGGASKAVSYVLQQLGIATLYVSRKAGKNKFSYEDLNEKVLTEHTVIVNCTPLGTHPNIEAKPSIPYEFVSEQHLLFDLIYNPAKTAFLTEGEKRGAQISNGLRMLELQADRAWEIWNS